MNRQDRKPDANRLKALLDTADVFGDAHINDFCGWGDSTRKRDVSGYHHGMRICGRVPNRLIAMRIRPRLNFAQQQMSRWFV